MPTNDGAAVTVPAVTSATMIHMARRARWWELRQWCLCERRTGDGVCAREVRGVVTHAVDEHDEVTRLHIHRDRVSRGAHGGAGDVDVTAGPGQGST